MKTMRRGWLLLVGVLWPVLVSAQLVVRPAEPEQGPFINPADQVPYQAGFQSCHNTLADAGARAALRAIEACPEEFAGNWYSYLTFARQAIVGISVPGVTEAAGGLALQKVAENAFFCISGALIEESGADAADQEYLKALLKDVKENADRAELVKNSLQKFRTGLIEKGGANYLKPAELEAFMKTLDANLVERYQGSDVDLKVLSTADARRHTPENRAREALRNAQSLNRECRYAEAEAALAEAQQANLDLLADVRGAVSRAKHLRYCIERDARLQQQNALDSVSPFLQHSLAKADQDIEAAMLRDAEQTQVVGELAREQQLAERKRNDVEYLKSRAGRQLEIARLAAGNCDFARAESALRAVDQETLDCAMLLDDQRRQRDEVRDQMRTLQTQLDQLEIERQKAVSMPFTELASCGDLSILADAIDQIPDGCRQVANAESMVASLRNRASACNEFKANSLVQQQLGDQFGSTLASPGTLFGQVEVAANKFEDHGNGSHTQSTYGPTESTWERIIPNQPAQATIQWHYNGVPDSLSPGQAVTITVTGGVTSESPPGIAEGLVLAGGVAIYGDVTIKTAQQADRGHPSGIYEFTVSPNPQSVEIHLGGAPAGTGAIWRYKKR